MNATTRLSMSTIFHVWFVWLKQPLVTPILFLASPYLVVNNERRESSGDLTKLKLEASLALLAYHAISPPQHAWQAKKASAREATNNTKQCNLFSEQSWPNKQQELNFSTYLSLRI